MDIPNRLLEKAISPNWDFKITDSWYFSPSYLEAGAIVFMLFLLTLSMARLRRMYVKWSFKGAPGMIALGFFIALILEGFMIIGGKTFMTEILGWKNPPKPIANVLDTSRKELVEVLGEADEIPSSSANTKIRSEYVISSFKQLNSTEAAKAKEAICTP